MQIIAAAALISNTVDENDQLNILSMLGILQLEPVLVH